MNKSHLFVAQFVFLMAAAAYLGDPRPVLEALHAREQFLDSLLGVPGPHRAVWVESDSGWEPMYASPDEGRGMLLEELLDDSTLAFLERRKVPA